MKVETLFQIEPIVYLAEGFQPVGSPHPYMYCVLELRRRLPNAYRDAVLASIKGCERGPDTDERGYQYVWFLDDPFTAKMAAKTLKLKLHRLGIMPSPKLFEGNGRVEFGSEAIGCRPSMIRYRRWRERSEKGTGLREALQSGAVTTVQDGLPTVAEAMPKATGNKPKRAGNAMQKLPRKK